MKLTVLINPAAGRGRAKKAFPAIAREMKNLSLDFEHRFSAGPGHIEELTREAVGRGSDLVVACGGDGTIHEVINGVGGRPATVGIIPCGTGDDLAKNLGIPRDIPGACRSLAAGFVKRFDMIRAGKKVYACVAGAGFDSMVNKTANEGVRFLKGTSVYIYSVFRTLYAFKPLEMSLCGDDFSYDGKVMFVVAANATSYGGGMKVTPMAVMDDGLMDVLIIKEMSRFQVLNLFPKVFSGKHYPHPKIEHHRTSTLTISSPEPLELFGDGEYIQALPVKLEVIPGALPVVVPGGSGRAV
jgi:diacylglycerol kinase (ATP)